MPYINQRWMGGLITNFRTIAKRIEQLRVFEQMEADGKFNELPKKEAKMRRTELHKLQKYLGGVRDMKSIPEAMFIVDLRKEYIAFQEAKKLGLKVVAVVDTNVDPTGVDYPIPGNDDAIRAVRLISKVIADGVESGRAAAGLTESDFAAKADETTAPPETSVESEPASDSSDKTVGEPDRQQRHRGKRHDDDNDIDLKESEVFQTE